MSFSAFSAGGSAGARKLYTYNFGGFTRTNEGGMLRVNAKNAEISGGGAHSAYALQKIVLKGDEIEFPAGIGKILRAATPGEVADVKYEDAVAVTEDLSVYRYEPNTEVYTKLSGITLTCVPNIVPYLSAENDEYAVLFGGVVAGVRAGGIVKKFASACYKNFGCAAFDRLFFASDEKTVKYSGVLAPADQADSADEGGYLVLAAGSAMRGMCAFKKHVYVFFEREIFRIDARGAARDFSVEKLAYGGGPIYENSAFDCGNKLCFTTDEGIYAFDGTAFENVTKKRTELRFSALQSVRCAGAAGKYLCGFGGTADSASSAGSDGSAGSGGSAAAKSILYNAENGAVTEIGAELETACAYGGRLYVYDGGAEKEFLFGNRAAGVLCRLERADEDFSACGVKTLKRVTVYGKGNAKLSVYGARGDGAESETREFNLALSESGAVANVDMSAEKFSVALEFSGGAEATGAAAQVYAFER